MTEELIETRLREVAAAQIGTSVEAISPELRFTEDLGLDSLDLTEMIVSLHDTIGDIDLESIEPEEIESIQTLGDLAHWLAGVAVAPRTSP